MMPVFGIFLAGQRPKRHKTRVGLAVVVLLGLMIGGCATGTKNMFTPPATSTITITAAGPGGTPSQSAPISVTVTQR
jgi:hypothetical protein